VLGFIVTYGRDVDDRVVHVSLRKRRRIMFGNLGLKIRLGRLGYRLRLFVGRHGRRRYVLV
jgi:hypothetical protein